MIVFMALFSLAVAVAVLCPDTFLGRYLRAVLIEAPARLLTREGLAKASFGVLACLFLVSLMAAPELVALMAVADIALYVEIMAMAVLLGAGARLRLAASAVKRAALWALQPLRRLAARPRRQAGARGRRVRRKPDRPKSDPDRGWAPAFA